MPQKPAGRNAFLQWLPICAAVVVMIGAWTIHRQTQIAETRRVEGNQDNKEVVKLLIRLGLRR